jgi:hypothetical protein
LLVNGSGINYHLGTRIDKALKIEKEGDLPAQSGNDIAGVCVFGGQGCK